MCSSSLERFSQIMSKPKCEGLISGFLIAANVILFLLSLVLIGASSFILWNRQLLFFLLNTFGTRFFPRNFTIPQDNLNEIAAQIWALMYPMAGLTLFVGLLLFVATLLAFVGVGLSRPEVLIGHAAVMGLLILMHVILVLIYFINKQLFVGNVRDLMIRTFQNFTTFDNSTTAYFNALISQVFPSVCCRPDSTGTAPNQCPANFTGTSYIETGCKFLIEERLITLTDYFANFSFIVMIITVLTFILAVLIIFYTKIN
ncbi:hypothetical protein FGIG_02218 [Fasciola gigantica]|uniref:Tetraspanin n=1 Tax=Fasciola gigantica TaxID=46835 RepID=A0A504Z7Q9_FASGI|nr:hypothetical protein FGIG_02218 [Fasciola gigantica]